MNNFLPLLQKEAQMRGWRTVDVVLVTGDAYVDHPSFGAAVIGRVLEAAGFSVGIVAMPQSAQDLQAFGKPNLCFAVTSGNVDSMIAKFTAFHKVRNDDPYAPEGKAHKPERALIRYCNYAKQAFKETPIVIGGVEASMRRMLHYDFWSNKVRRSILEDTRAQILVYGMGEKPIVEIAERLRTNTDLSGIPGTLTLTTEKPHDAFELALQEKVMSDKKLFIEFYKEFYRHRKERMVQPTAKRFLLHEPPAELSTTELDAIYDLPFTRLPHPSYDKEIPAFRMIQHSITAHRGCVSGCSFCSLTLHQGKEISSRSEQSILNEVKSIVSADNFKGHINDIGGPSANMWGASCKKNWQNCRRESCLFPNKCPNLEMATEDWLNLLDKANRQKGVKKVTVGSGIRFDQMMSEKNGNHNLRRLIKSHIAGRLKIAPEHTRQRTLRAMHKTPLADTEKFVTLFKSLTPKGGHEQYPAPYLMSNHPGTTLQDMHDMKRDVQRLFGGIPEQVQSFIPLPMTIASVIYYTGIDPLTGEKFPVERNPQKKREQHEVFFQKRKEKPDRKKQHTGGKTNKKIMGKPSSRSGRRR